MRRRRGAVHRSLDGAYQRPDALQPLPLEGKQGGTVFLVSEEYRNIHIREHTIMESPSRSTSTKGSVCYSVGSVLLAGRSRAIDFPYNLSFKASQLVLQNFLSRHRVPIPFLLTLPILALLIQFRGNVVISLQQLLPDISMVRRIGKRRLPYLGACLPVLFPLLALCEASKKRFQAAVVWNTVQAAEVVEVIICRHFPKDCSRWGICLFLPRRCWFMDVVVTGAGCF